MSDRELMQQALEALEALTHSIDTEELLHDDQRSAYKQCIATINALRERLAQQSEMDEALRLADELEQKAIHGTGSALELGAAAALRRLHEENERLKEPRQWVGLTDEDKAELDEKYGDDTLAHLDAIEAKLREKNT